MRLRCKSELEALKQANSKDRLTRKGALQDLMTIDGTCVHALSRVLGISKQNLVCTIEN
jgi:hypothetical protein